MPTTRSNHQVWLHLVVPKTLKELTVPTAIQMAGNIAKLLGEMNEESEKRGATMDNVHILQTLAFQYMANFGRSQIMKTFSAEQKQLFAALEAELSEQASPGDPPQQAH